MPRKTHKRNNRHSNGNGTNGNGHNPIPLEKRKEICGGCDHRCEQYKTIKNTFPFSPTDLRIMKKHLRDGEQKVLYLCANYNLVSKMQEEYGLVKRT